ncbi:MAG TPA: peptidase M10 [Chitinophagaceae bacterium]|nr:peptidase M10 [Chitinophagaceae bacterium]
MGSAELDIHHRHLIIYSNIITYGNAGSPEIAADIAEEIETMWNEPQASLKFANLKFEVVFRIHAWYNPSITPFDIYRNLDPKNNYFRIEEFSHNHISFVDGLNCNSGYFKLENLYKGSTTAAHEYGHTIGLNHPDILDIRGQGIPGIMYPRGTLVDPQYQYDPSKPAGVTGGTMHPMYRKVKLQDIEDLKLHRLEFHHGKAVLGEFTNVWHEDHAKVRPEDFFGGIIEG